MDIFRQAVDTLFLGFLLVMPATGVISMRNRQPLRTFNASFVESATLLMRVVGLLFTGYFLSWWLSYREYIVVTHTSEMLWLRPVTIVVTTQLLWIRTVRKTPLVLSLLALSTITVQFDNLKMLAGSVRRSYQTDGMILFMLLIALAIAAVVFVVAVRLVMFLRAIYRRRFTKHDAGENSNFS